jgi:hypothetical protein
MVDGGGCGDEWWRVVPLLRTATATATVSAKLQPQWRTDSNTAHRGARTYRKRYPLCTRT